MGSRRRDRWASREPSRDRRAPGAARSDATHLFPVADNFALGASRGVNSDRPGPGPDNFALVLGGAASAGLSAIRPTPDGGYRQSGPRPTRVVRNPAHARRGLSAIRPTPRRAPRGPTSPAAAPRSGGSVAEYPRRRLAIRAEAGWATDGPGALDRATECPGQASHLGLDHRVFVAPAVAPARPIGRPGQLVRGGHLIPFLASRSPVCDSRRATSSVPVRALTRPRPTPDGCRRRHSYNRGP